jgi:hypothetical protein
MSVLTAILAAIIDALRSWLKAEQQESAASEAGARRGQVESVGEARELEARLQEIAGAPPGNPRIGERWIDPRSGVVMEWTGTAWTATHGEEGFDDEGWT